jgi:hypothetical protein
VAPILATTLKIQIDFRAVLSDLAVPLARDGVLRGHIRTGHGGDKRQTQNEKCRYFPGHKRSPVDVLVGTDPDVREYNLFTRQEKLGSEKISRLFR